MDKVLIVEDDKMLGKVIDKKVAALGFKAIHAYTREEALAKMARIDFFAALLDLNLPDAPYGEVVDDVLERKIPSIILTSLYDDDTRINVSTKPIVDYVIKTREESIDYAVKTLQRIRRYSRMKALVVEDSAPQRQFIKKMTEELLFETFEAEDGVKALEIIEKHPDIALVVTDYNMPNMDGLELMLKLRRDYKEDQMVIIALTGYDSKELSSRFLKFGASDYLPKPFTKEEFNYRINKKMDIFQFIEEIKDYSEKLEIANNSIRHANEAKLRYIQTIEEYLDIIDKNVLLTKTDKEGKITYASNAFCRISGFNMSELIGKDHNVMRHPDMPKKIFKDMWGTIEAGKSWEGEIKNRKKCGEPFWLKTTISPLMEGSRHVGYVSIRTNLTDKMLAQKLIVTDALTGVYNRLKIDEMLESEIDRATRYQTSFALIFMDLDRFTKVNDQEGHMVGDKVLIQFALVVKQKIRSIDVFSRWSGPEFALLLPNTEIEGAKILADRLREATENEMFEDRLKLTASFGVSANMEGDDKNTLVRRVEMLLRTAKENGGNSVVAQG